MKDKLNCRTSRCELTCGLAVLFIFGKASLCRILVVTSLAVVWRISVEKAMIHSLKPITIIYNQMFSVAFVASEWKKAVITPVHKKGLATTCSNYRPISITCVTSKLLEHVITNQICNYLAGNNLLHSAQHGILHLYFRRSELRCKRKLILQH